MDRHDDCGIRPGKDAVPGGARHLPASCHERSGRATRGANSAACQFTRAMASSASVASASFNRCPTERNETKGSLLGAARRRPPLG